MPHPSQSEQIPSLRDLVRVRGVREACHDQNPECEHYWYALQDWQEKWVTGDNGQKVQLTQKVLSDYLETTDFIDKEPTLTSTPRNTRTYAEGEGSHVSGATPSSHEEKCGALMPLCVNYKDRNGTPIPEIDQARVILDNARKLYLAGYQKLGITYSANKNQYDELQGGSRWQNCIKGSHQAKVVKEMAQLLRSEDQYACLDRVFKIFPLVSMGFKGPYDETVLQDNIANIRRAIYHDNVVVFGWQNQDTVGDIRCPFAFGRGRAKTTSSGAINEEQLQGAQKSLCQLREDYPPTEDIKKILLAADTAPACMQSQIHNSPESVSHDTTQLSPDDARVSQTNIVGAQTQASAAIVHRSAPTNLGAEIASGFAVSSKQGEAEANGVSGARSSSHEEGRRGALMPLCVNYKDQSGTSILPMAQARVILDTALKLLSTGGYTSIGVTYSASKGQYDQIKQDISSLEFVKGHGQAAVMRELATILKSDDQYLPLRSCFKIFPLVSCGFTAGYDEQLLKTNIGDIEDALQDGVAVLAWQNQDTVGNSKRPFAFADGAARKKLSGAINKEQLHEAQQSLCQLVVEYPPTTDVMKDEFSLVFQHADRAEQDELDKMFETIEYISMGDDAQCVAQLEAIQENLECSEGAKLAAGKASSPVIRTDLEENKDLEEGACSRVRETLEDASCSIGQGGGSEDAGFDAAAAGETLLPGCVDKLVDATTMEQRILATELND